jgi:hypothetical protein
VELGPRLSALPPTEHPELAEPAPEFPRLPPGPTASRVEGWRGTQSARLQPPPVR